MLNAIGRDKVSEFYQGTHYHNIKIIQITMLLIVHDMKKFICILLGIFLSISCTSQHYESVQIDLQYCLEKTFLGQVSTESKPTMFYLLVKINQGVLSVTIISHDINTINKTGILLQELRLRNSFKKVKRSELMIPVFFTSSKADSLVLKKEEYFALIDAFPRTSIKVVLLKRIILSIPEKRI